MPAAVAPPPATRYRGLYPDWEGVRPLAWFFVEQLLEARAESAFPTNAAGHDEDVNVYLAALLETWVSGDVEAGVLARREPLLLPPDPGTSRLSRADHYRRPADHHLLALGLFDRGDLQRRRVCSWRETADETRRHDLAVAQHCYDLAADQLAGREAGRAGLVAVWRALAARLPDYVHVLQTLARRRLGLGARLSGTDLDWLLTPPEPE